MLPIRTILHATDFSETSMYALHAACSLAQDYGARLYSRKINPKTGRRRNLGTFATREGAERQDCF